MSSDICLDTRDCKDTAVSETPGYQLMNVHIHILAEKKGQTRFPSPNQWR